ALATINGGGLVDLNNPAKSFRPNNMVHNCKVGSTDPRYSCSETAENNLKKRLIAGIESWRQANINTAKAHGAQDWRSLSRNERLPGRVKYKFKITESGKYNVWLKLKTNTNTSYVHY